MHDSLTYFYIVLVVAASVFVLLSFIPRVLGSIAKRTDGKRSDVKTHRKGCIKCEGRIKKG